MICLQYRFARIGILIVCLALLSSLASAQRTVRVLVADSYGDSLSAADADLLVSGAGRAFTTHPDTPLNLWPGQYTVRVTAPGFDERTEQFYVDQEDQILAVTVHIGSTENNVIPTCIVRGTVSSHAAASRLRLIDPFGTFSRDIRPAKDLFEFKDLPCGDYLLLAWDGKRLVGTQQVHAAVFPTSLKIDFSAMDAKKVQ